MFRAAAAVLCLVVAGFALAQPCRDFGSQTLEIEDFGIARFGALDYDSQHDQAVLRGGVCIVPPSSPGREPIWRIVATRMTVTHLRTEPRFTLQQASLELPDWTLYAETLNSTPEGFALQQLSFQGENARGRAQAGSYDLKSHHLALQKVEARGKGFRVRGDTASLEGQKLLFRGARITTCVCEGGALYVVAAPTASLDLIRQRVVIDRGILKIGKVEIALAPEVELSQRSLERIRFPLVVSQSDATGLSVRTQPLPLAEGVGLELGASRLDRDQPQGILLLVVDSPTLDLTFGAAAQGFQADLERQWALTSGMSLAMGIRNRSWDAADYLHEGYLSLRARHTVKHLLLTQDQLDLTASATAAASSQILDDALASQVASPRLKLQAGANYTLSDTPFGALGLDLDGSFSSYPAYHATQVGLRLSPSWQLPAGPLSASVRYDLQMTDSGSPFSTALDKLMPVSRLTAKAGLAGILGSGVQGTLDAAFRSNFLADGVRHGPIETAKLTAGATLDLDGSTLQPSLELELAQLLTPSQDSDAEAYLQGQLAFDAPALHAALLAKYDLVEGLLDALEVSAALPIALDPVTLQPFLALDLAGVVTGSGPVRLSGHGMELTYRNCCGTVTLGYRLHRGEFSTTLSIELPATLSDSAPTTAERATGHATTGDGTTEDGTTKEPHSRHDKGDPNQ